VQTEKKSRKMDTTKYVNRYSPGFFKPGSNRTHLNTKKRGEREIGYGSETRKVVLSLKGGCSQLVAARGAKKTKHLASHRNIPKRVLSGQREKGNSAGANDFIGTAETRVTKRNCAQTSVERTRAMTVRKKSRTQGEPKIRNGKEDERFLNTSKRANR